MLDYVTDRSGQKSNHPRNSNVADGTCEGGNVLHNDKSVEWKSMDQFDGYSVWYFYPTAP